ncbi:SLIT-ROBO Rho GTPase-activating protein 1-like Protein [Tribolium castaneum]|uniref:SLIT-ROBO Rho GTPase-activating protein 1-like Protein n=1 Tax=Tribolium castaneum TaxID=7070 RepID=D6W740_TRICA|nr:PREDICTED: SLIT-ROBO Rho GTPase-activating protein 1 isoform X1 [Tribolium castaneum]EFA11413.2 SLIT-ROBO Rho GTPase-activating protein 1-like Protein [Tribolium castaneum]|eukprot:XP_008193451.1 PREDICTED: SLIT-ROBO Rho GTPase-activating protein 1 isoform X1 [Tribolium castaneum]
MDENEQELKSPIKRLGSTRKLLVFNNIRLQLNEQLRCLDMRMEAQVALVTELQDFFRRRGELELDYSKNLDKLAKSLQLRHKEQKQKREQWPLFSSYTCWQQLVTQTKNLSRDHVALSEVYSTHLVSRLSQVMEDVQRIYKRCREIGYETHEEILRVLHELHTTMKTYHSYQAELRQAEAKLKSAETQRAKLEQSLSQDKLDRSKKYKLMEKEVMKRKNKYTDAKLKALKARNEYILCLEASNTTIHKYFVDDLSDLIDCMDFGFHNCISRALLMHVTAEEGRQRSVQNGLDTLSACINSLDSRLDKQRFLEYNHTAFMIPKKLEFQGQKQEEPAEPEIQKVLHQEMESRLRQLQQRVTSLRTESEEVWKTLETAESTLLEMLNAKDYDCSAYFGENAVPASKPPETVSIKLRADRQETEEFYLTKFREYLLGSTKIARLDAKQEYIRQSLLSEAPDYCSTLKPVVKTPRRKRIGRLQMSGQPKLFGGSLEEYLEATNQDIPLIMKSCIRVINLYGLHHQGIFRVSGSQVEINNFREWFERGEDPLADMTDASDINSVAGVLKLYLRELREPLFPIIYFEQFMELAQLESKREFIVRMKELINSLPRTVIVVMRYLFAFLNHLSEFSDENMMDPYNLAICFGPTLVPVPDDKDQVQYQNQVNELIKNIIMFNEEIFPNDGGTVYEKYISPEPDDHDVGDLPSDQVPEDLDSEVYPSEDDSENMEATAQFDFIARSDRELSLKKGDTVTLYSQVSNDWWKGSVKGQEGLIPDKYISLKMKDDDREKLENLKSSSSEESMRRRVSSSNDSMLSESSVSASNSPLVQCAPVTWTNVSDMNESISSENNSVILNQTRENGHNRLKSLDISLESHLLNRMRDPVVTINVNQTPQNITINGSPVMQSRKLEKSETVPEIGKSETDIELRHKSEIDESNLNFSQNREQWQRRAVSQSHIPLSQPQTLKANRNSESYLQRQNHTPDLVMDLPLVGNSSPKETTKKSMSVSGNLTSEGPLGDESHKSPESPDMQTAAERFAKQNQCTLKKNTKVHVDSSDSAETNLITITSPMPERKYATIGSATTTFKPQLKAKPPVLKKPAFSVPMAAVSSEVRKDQPDLPT